MSVRAYLVHEDVKIIDGKRYVHEDLEYLWNNWHDSEIFDILYPFMNDMTNDDCIGEIEICYEEFDDFKIKYQESNQSSRIHKVVEEHKEVFKTLDDHFKKGNDWATIKLY